MSYNMSNRSNLERSGRMEYISPMSDVIFKQMFSREENKDMLRGLVKAFLEVDIGNDFKIAGNELPPYNPDEKFPRIDLHASSNIGEVDIEVQVSTDSNFTQRFTNYAMQLYDSSVKRGDVIYKPRPVMALGILSNTVLPQTEKWITEFKLLETQEHFPLLDNFKLCFAELSKAPRKLNEQLLEDDRIAWATYFISSGEEDFAVLKEHAKQPEVQKAITVLGNFSNDPEMQELAKRRRESEEYKRSVLSAYFNDGKAEGTKKMVQALRDMGLDEGAITEAVKRAQGNVPIENKIQQKQQEPQAPRISPPKHGRR